MKITTKTTQVQVLRNIKIVYTILQMPETVV